MPKNFSAKQLQEYLQTEHPKLIDVREPWEYSICHIADSELIPMGQIPNRIDQFQNDTEYVIICHHGIRSMQVIRYLQHFQINRTINLDGGIDAWAREVDISMSVY